MVSVLRRTHRPDAGACAGHAIDPCRRCGSTDVGPLSQDAIGDDVDLAAMGIHQCHACGGIVHRALRC